MGHLLAHKAQLQHHSHTSLFSNEVSANYTAKQHPTQRGGRGPYRGGRNHYRGRGGRYNRGGRGLPTSNNDNGSCPSPTNCVVC